MNDLILWGFHPSHCDGVPIKLNANASRNEIKWRKLEGWTTHEYRSGDKPIGLRQIADAKRVERAKYAILKAKGEQSTP